jgi:hypothetical protein
MKHVKTIALAAITAAALMAFAGNAWATSLTSPAGTTYTSTIAAESGKVELHPGSGSSFLTVSCNKSQFSGSVQKHGAGVTVGGATATFIFQECTDTFTVLTAGTYEIHGLGSGNGTWTLTAFEFRIHTSEGPVCTGKTSSTTLGTLTGGTPAKLDLGSASIPMSGFLCPSTAVLTGSYTIKTPGTLLTD